MTKPDENWGAVFCEWHVRPRFYSKDKVKGDTCARYARTVEGGRHLCRLHAKMMKAGKRDDNYKPHRKKYRR